MKKYGALGTFLRGQGRDYIPMTFDEIERVTGTRLPRSQRYPAWWSNNTSNNVMTRIWLDAGYRTESVDIEGRKLVFRRTSAFVPPESPPPPLGGSGMSDEGRAFRAPEADGEKKPYRSPLWGAMKGTFTLVPPDGTEQPPDDPDSWEALALAKFDRLLFGKGE
jgi:peptidoglycan/xylan/chitin deacetylase (PgdA/CDA1 family)